MQTNANALQGVKRVHGYITRGFNRSGGKKTETGDRKLAAGAMIIIICLRNIGL